MDDRNPQRIRLFTPGPVDISGRAMDGLLAPIDHHRSDAFRDVSRQLLDDLKTAFQTEEEVIAMTASGTGAMEAVVVSLFSPGDSVIVPVSGKFSRRWADICDTYGLNVRRIELAPGETPTPEQVRDGLAHGRPASGVLLTHCETSNGSLLDLEAASEAIADFSRRTGEEILACADCTSTLCIDEMRQDAWGLDCAIAASQKGLLSPPGLAFVSLNRRAIQHLESTRMPRYYFDLSKYFRHGADCPFTPAVAIVNAVQRSLEAILALGLERVWAANRAAARAVTLIVDAAGMRPVAVRQASGAVAFWTEGIDAVKIARMLREEHGIVVAQGQEELKDRILRVAPIGKSRSDILAFGRAFEATLRVLGRRFALSRIEGKLEQILEEVSIWQ